MSESFGVPQDGWSTRQPDQVNWKGLCFTNMTFRIGEFMADLVVALAQHENNAPKQFAHFLEHLGNTSGAQEFIRANPHRFIWNESMPPMERMSDMELMGHFLTLAKRHPKLSEIAALQTRDVNMKPELRAAMLDNPRPEDVDAMKPLFQCARALLDRFAERGGTSFLLNFVGDETQPQELRLWALDVSGVRDAVQERLHQSIHPDNGPFLS